MIGWGDNTLGELGDGTTSTATSPVAVHGLNGQVLQVVAAGVTSVAICRDCDPTVPNTVWAWGDGSYGALGVPASGLRSCNVVGAEVPCSPVPVEVDGPGGVGHLGGIQKVASDGGHVLALDGTGHVWGWGSNSENDVGPGPDQPCPGNPPLRCVMSPELVPTLHDVVDVAASGTNVAAERDGTAWAWGDNGSGGLGQGTDGYNSTQYSSAVPLQVKSPHDPTGFLQRVIAVADGDHLTVLQQGSAADGSDNMLWTWGGDNLDGELGVGYVGSAGSGSGTQFVDLPQQVVTQPGGSQPFRGALALGQWGVTVVRFDPSGADTVWGWTSYEQADGGAGDFGRSARTTPRQLHASSGTDCGTPGPFLAGVPPDPAVLTGSGAIVKQAGQTQGTVWLWGVNFYSPYTSSDYSPGWAYTCRFPVQAVGIAASAISSGSLFDLAIGQIVGPPPTPTPTPSAQPVNTSQQTGPAPGAGPGTTPPQPGVPVTSTLPGGAPVTASGQPPAPPPGLGSSVAGAQAPVGGTVSQPGSVGAAGSPVAPVNAPGGNPATGGVPRVDYAPDSADDYAMIRHDAGGPAAVVGLAGGAAAMLVFSLAGLGRRRRRGASPHAAQATARRPAAGYCAMGNNATTRLYSDCSGTRPASGSRVCGW